MHRYNSTRTFWFRLNKLAHDHCITGMHPRKGTSLCDDESLGATDLITLFASYVKNSTTLNNSKYYSEPHEDRLMLNPRQKCTQSHILIPRRFVAINRRARFQLNLTAQHAKRSHQLKYSQLTLWPRARSIVSRVPSPHAFVTILITVSHHCFDGRHAFYNAQPDVISQRRRSFDC